MEKERTLIEPIPSVIAKRGPFSVLEPEDTGLSNKDPKEFIAPLGTTDAETAIRAHQYGHLHIARHKLFCAEDIPHQLWFEALADNYVNPMLRELGVDIDGVKIDGQAFAPDMSAPDRGSAARLYAASLAIGEEESEAAYEFTKELFPRLNLVPIKEIVDAIHIAGKEQSAINGKQIKEWIEKLKELYPDRNKFSATRQVSPLKIRAASRILNGLSKTAMSKPGGKHKESDKSHQWGRMSIVNIPLPLTHRPPPAIGRATRKSRASFIGAFRYPHRANLIISDGRCFGLKRKEQHGTVVIDCSGSMDITNSEVQKILNHAPAATIAIYAGDMDGMGGKLIVVANKKRREDVNRARSRLGPLNIIDGPVLDWLGKQAEPRVWVSDGVVTGRDESTNVGLYLQRDKKKKQYRIRQAGNAKDAINLFKKLSQENK